MRLLSLSKDGKWLIRNFSTPVVPFYAVLSHTWDHDDAEVTFEDIEHGTRDFDDRSKPGFEKLRFCCRKAEDDGLRYFWIDTCCIKKSDSAELQRSLNSMFYWYRRAIRCYVLLSDVSVIPSEGENFDAVEAFKDCKWFKRGWTLQELIAPSSVVFYSKEKSRVGDKAELEEAIAAATKMPIMALRGGDLSHFSVQERFSWAEHRTTTVPEDAAYCLLGVFNVHMHLSYADGVYSERKEEALYLLDRTIKQYELDRKIKLASKNAKQGKDVMRIGGASWYDLSQLDQSQLQDLDRRLEGYIRWLLNVIPRGHHSGVDEMTKLSTTAGNKIGTLLAEFGVAYDDLSSLENTVKTWNYPWNRYQDKSKPDQIRVQALVENRWYWTRKNEDVFTGITAARTLIDLMIWRGKWTA